MTLNELSAFTEEKYPTEATVGEREVSMALARQRAFMEGYHKRCDEIKTIGYDPSAMDELYKVLQEIDARCVELEIPSPLITKIESALNKAKI